MRKLFLVFFISWFVLKSYSQIENTSSAPIKDYTTKSKNQKKAARIMLFGGAGLILTGLLIPQGDYTSYNLLYGPEHKNDDIKAAFFVSGTLSMLGSIPLFIASSRNKRKARATISFKNEKILLLHKNIIVQESQASINLKIDL